MAEPKKKLSKTRTNLRRAQYKARDIEVTTCSNCKKPVVPHTVCPNCGFYGGKQVTQQTPTKRIVLDPENSSK